MGLVQIHEPRDFTLADLDDLPEDGRRYELVDGMLLVTPSPSSHHQRSVVRFVSLLAAACPPELEVFVAPFDYRPDDRRSLQPDLLVCRAEDVGPRCVERPLLLAIEVLSPNTRIKDQLVKRAVYEQSGVASYWIFDSEAEELTVLELVDGAYVERAVVKGEDEFVARLPFPVRIVPAELIRKVNRSAT